MGASAATAPPAGDGWIWGMDFTTLGDDVSIPPLKGTASGWTIDGAQTNSFLAGGHYDGQSSYHALLSLSDPAHVMAGNGTYAQDDMWLYLDSEFVDGDGPWGSDWKVGYSSRMVFTCSTAEWSQSTTQVVTSSGGVSSSSGRNASRTGLSALVNARTVCPYVVGVEAVIDVYAADGTPVTHLAKWGSVGSTAGPGLPGTGGTGGTGGTPPNDGTDFATVCSEGDAVLVPLSFQWMGHYMGCLFTPTKGFDQSGAVASAWTDGTAGQLMTMMGTLGTSFNVSETCGVILGERSNDPTSPLDKSPFGGNFRIDTCSWNDWAGGMKTFLMYAIYIFGGFWLIKFLVQSVVGILNRKSASPLEDNE